MTEFQIYRHTLFYFIFQIFHFLHIEGLCQKESLLEPIFPIAFAHSVPLYHILVVLEIFQTLHHQKDNIQLTEGSDG